MVDTSGYRRKLVAIRDYLGSFDDRHWAPVIDTWISELDRSSTDAEIATHVERSQRATGGMGSLGDLSIAPMNGHKISDDRAVIGAASRRLWSMTEDLYQECNTILGSLQA